jgi:hypothetical protein
MLPGPSVSAPSLRCHALSHSLPHPATDHRAPVATWPRLSAAPAPCRPCPASLPYSLPITAQAPLSLLLPPPRGCTHTDPLFPSLGPCHRANFIQNERRSSSRPHFTLPLLSPPEPPEPRTTFSGQHPRSSPEHRGPVSRRDLAAATTLLPFLGGPPSEPLLSKSTTLTHLSLSLPLTRRVCRRSSGSPRPPVSSEHRRAEALPLP